MPTLTVSDHESSASENESDCDSSSSQEGGWRSYTLTGLVPGESLSDFVNRKDAEGDYKKLKGDFTVHTITKDDIVPGETIAQLVERKESADKKL